MLLPGSNMSSVSSCLLKGSVEEFNKCLVITCRSQMIPLGSKTGSNITVSINGSGGKIKRESIDRMSRLIKYDNGMLSTRCPD